MDIIYIAHVGSRKYVLYEEPLSTLQVDGTSRHNTNTIRTNPTTPTTTDTITPTYCPLTLPMAFTTTTNSTTTIITTTTTKSSSTSR